MKTWLITGASRGFGILVAEEALRRGDRVVASARNPAAIVERFGSTDHLTALPLDVTDSASVTDAMDAAVDSFASIDVLLNNAGYGVVGAVEETSVDEARKVFDVNVFGLLAVTRAVLPVMRAQRSGHLIHISSVAGFTGSPGWGVYAATKHAVEALNESLHAELAPLGIRSTAIEPGTFRTDFLDASSLAAAGSEIADYVDTAAVSRQWSASANHAQVGDPVRAAKAIVDVAHMQDPPIRLALGSDCYARLRKKFATLNDDLAQWRSTTLSTDYRGPEGA